MKATKKQLDTLVKELDHVKAIKLLSDFNEPERILALGIELELTLDEVINGLVESGNDIIEYGNEEYYVLTDSEADEKNDESIENYIDDCIIPELPKHLQNYFDSEAFKRDARYDGRGHNLAGCDGNENDQKVNGITYFIYRWN